MSSVKGEVSDGEESSTPGSHGEREYFGCVYHLGVNSIGREYCHLRYLLLRGRYVAMYKRDPHEFPGIQPIRKGVISQTLMVEELGRRKVNGGEIYVLRFYNRLDETKKGEIACATAGEARKWMKAFDQAKQQIVYDLSVGSGSRKLSIETELNLDGHRPRVRRYAHGLRKLIRIGKGQLRNLSIYDNFLIDVDIGSSSVARSIIGLVLGYITSIVVDLAILIEATEEEELPEYILGTVCLNRLRLDSAVEI